MITRHTILSVALVVVLYLVSSMLLGFLLEPDAPMSRDTVALLSYLALIPSIACALLCRHFTPLRKLGSVGITIRRKVA